MKPMATDQALLQRYLNAHDERAFAELVERHVNLVFEAALRRTGGRTHLAEEIAQKVFSDLSRKAASLVSHPALEGWLYRSTRYAAIDAIRAESRRQQLARSLTAMPDAASSPDATPDWDQLRPVLDEAMDELKEHDRQLVLLRYFGGLTFSEAGARLNLSEDGARRRAERALDHLRGHLGKRGLTSTTAALGLLLANQPLVAAPAGLAASVTTAALATAPAGGAGLLAFLLMNKIAAPVCSAILAAGLTTAVWISAAHPVSAQELTALRQENARLAAATANGADPAAAAGVAAEYAQQAAAIVRAMAKRSSAGASTASGPGRPAVTARGHSDHGQATAHDAELTFAWAGDVSDSAALAKLIYFDPAVRPKAQAVLAGMPDMIQANFATPEEFYGFLIALSSLESPPPAADIINRTMTEVLLSPDRVAFRRNGSSVNFHEYQLTPDGWKYVFPERGVETAPGILNSDTLAKVLGP